MSLPDTIVVAHGKSELILARAIATRLKVPIEVFSINRGEETISLGNIGKILSEPPFDSEISLHRRYGTIEYSSRKRTFPRLTIIPIVDVDGDGRSARAYKTGEIFKDSIFQNRILPILNEPNLEAVMLDIGYPPVKDKVDWYSNMVINPGELYEKLQKSDKTNMDLFLKHIMDRCPSFQNKY